MLEHLVRLGKRGHSLGVNIPNPVLEALGWPLGSYIQLMVVEDGVLLTKPKLSQVPTVTYKKRQGRDE